MLAVTASPYNADNTGVRDARAAIQAAIDDVASSPARGGLVHFSAGSYRIDLAEGLGLTLRPRIQYRGEGRGNTRLRLGNRAAGELLRIVEGGHDITLRDMTIDLAGMSVEGTRALVLALADTQRILIEDVTFTTEAEDLHGVGLRVGTGADTGEVGVVTLQRCAFTQAGAAALQVRAGVQHLRVYGCSFSRKPGGALYTAIDACDDAGAGTTPRIEDIVVEQCSFSDAFELRFKGRLLAPTAFRPITGVSIRTNWIAGAVTLEAVRDAMIHTNTLRSPSATPLVIRRSHQLHVSGNQIEASAGHGIHFDGRGPEGAPWSFPVEDLQVVGNIITQAEPTCVGLFIDSAERGVISGNIITYQSQRPGASPGIYFCPTPALPGAAPTHQSLLIVQNIISGFASGIHLAQPGPPPGSGQLN